MYKNRSSRKIDSWGLFSREYDFPKTFSLTEKQFSGKTYFCTIASSLWESGSLYARDPNPYLKRALYIYWATKVVELSDTVFMLLRHKFRGV